MIVDDSAIAPVLNSRWVNEDRELEVVSRCLVGQLAVERIEAICPDVLVLDIEMPVTGHPAKSKVGNIQSILSAAEYARISPH